MVERLNWACGPVVREGWHHSDERWSSGMRTDDDYPQPRDHLGRIQNGLPWSQGFFDYVVSHHGLMMLAEDELVPALVELRRVTKPGGWIRLSVPDIQAAIDAWRTGYQEWFPLDAPDIDTAFCRYVTQGGQTRSIFTAYRLCHLLAEAGWTAVTEVACGVSVAATAPGITELDSRPDESLYVEARR